MRIVSLIPAATEILFAVGAGDDVVGVTFECDFPPAARERRVVSTSAMPEGLTAQEIDDFVRAALASGEDLYRLDADALAELDADLVVTQDLCAVCAIDVATVDDALTHLGCRADVATIDPHTLDDVLASIAEIGRRTDRVDEAAAVVASLEYRLAAVEARVAGRAASTSTAARRSPRACATASPAFRSGRSTPTVTSRGPVRGWSTASRCWRRSCTRRTPRA